MTAIPAPDERMHDFISKLDISEDDFALLAAHAPFFISHKKEYGRYVLDYFRAIPRTRIILDHCQPPDKLAEILAEWFESLFKERMTRPFLSHLWRSGLRHVDLNIDQRYINLAYAITRQFCQNIVREIEHDLERERVEFALDKLLDFCMLVATDSFITATSRCDREVIRGIAHQVRNPTTIIGGSIMRLKKKVEQGIPDFSAFEVILKENERLERMIKDIAVYTDMFQNEPDFKTHSTETLIVEAINRLKETPKFGPIDIVLDIDPSRTTVQGDYRDLSTLFYYTLENSFEASAAEGHPIRISARVSDGARFLKISIHNKGSLPEDVEKETLFEPFYSSKPTGTGFGLAIARLASRKNLGDIHLENDPEQGVRSVITLTTGNHVES